LRSVERSRATASRSEDIFTSRFAIYVRFLFECVPSLGMRQLSSCPLPHPAIRQPVRLLRLPVLVASCTPACKHAHE
jgi:hypothetical protein